MGRPSSETARRPSQTRRGAEEEERETVSEEAEAETEEDRYREMATLTPNDSENKLDAQKLWLYMNVINHLYYDCIICVVLCIEL